jgi:superfamily II DNA helicase RecQ
MLRTFLPQGVPFVALSATLTPCVRLDLCKHLELQSNYLFINEGNDRSNVTIICRECIHPLKSYVDIHFVVPSGIKEASRIPKTFVYADTVEDGTGIVDYLTECLPVNLQEKGLI